MTFILMIVLDDATTSAPAAATTPDLTPQRLSKGPPNFDYNVKPKSTILEFTASYDIPEMAAWTRENEALIYEVIWSLCNARAGWETIQQL